MHDGWIVFLLWAAGAVGAPSLLNQSFSLDMGTSDAMTKVAGRHCWGVVGSGTVSDVLTTGGVAHRTLAEGSVLVIKCDLSSYDIPSFGVPYVDIVLSINYRDDTDQSLCAVGFATVTCRDAVQAPSFALSSSFVWAGSLGGRNDHAWHTEDVVIMATPHQQARATGGVFTFRVENIPQSGGLDPLAVANVTLRFVTKEVAQAIRRAQLQEYKLVLRQYNDGLYASGPPAAGRPFALYTRNYLESVFANTAPRDDEVDPAKPTVISVHEVRGETEPVTVCVWAFQALEGVTVEVVGLESVAKVTAFEVVQVERRWAENFEERYGPNPWVIRPLAKPGEATDANWNRVWPGVKVPAGSTRQFWLNVAVLRDAAKGYHTGTVRVCAQGVSCREAALNLEVIAVTLGRPAAETYVYLYSNYPDFSPTRPHIAKDIAAHGPFIGTRLRGRGVILVNGTVDFSPMRPEIESLLAEGALTPSNKLRVENWNSPGGWRDLWFRTYNNRNYFLNRPETDAFDAAMRSVLRQYSALAASYGLELEHSFQDEPSDRVELRRYTSHLMRLAKEVGQRTWVSWYFKCERCLAGETLHGSSPTTHANVSIEATLDVGVTIPTGAFRFWITTTDWTAASCGPRWLYVNGVLAWSVRCQEHETMQANVSLTGLIRAGQQNTVTLRAEMGTHTTSEVRFCFADLWWRERPWQPAGAVSSHTHTADPLGDLGPLSQYLDEAAISSSLLGTEQVEMTRSLGVTPSYYTTFQGTVPAPIFNRVIHGVGASSYGLHALMSFAYDVFCRDFWDDQSGQGQEPYNQFGDSSYQLVMTSWDPMVYDTIPWEALREGVEDSRVIWRLQELLVSHPDDQASAYLTALLGKLSRDYWSSYTNPRPSKPIEFYFNPIDLMQRDLCGNSSDYHCLDNIRLQLLRFIEALEPAVSPSSSSSSSPPTDSRSSDKRSHVVNGAPPSLPSLLLLVALASSSSLIWRGRF